MSRRCEPKRLPLNPGFAPDMIMLAMLAMIMLAAPSNTLLTLVALARPVPLLVAGSGGDSWRQVAVGGVAGLRVAVAVLHLVRRLAVGNADMCASPHHTVTCKVQMLNLTLILDNNEKEI